MSGSSNVLVLGAGLVSRPLARYFLDDDRCRLTAASLHLDEARALVAEHPRGVACRVDVTDARQLEPLIRQADLVISLVPYTYHVSVARLAIEHRVNMVTASYVSPEMRGLDEEARRAGVTILNEVGLDPGLDHMSAMRLIDAIRGAGGRITDFTSCCGSLPAPEAADNPWKYKISWSPRGVLLAGTLPARYLYQGRAVDIPGATLFGNHWPYEVERVGSFEIYPNRNSTGYLAVYGLRNLRTMLRATIRYPGWSRTMKHLADLGLLDDSKRSWPPGTTYRDHLAGCLPAGSRPVEERLLERLGIAREDPTFEKMEWAGLLSNAALPEGAGSSLDVLAQRFAERLAYAPGERDMVLLRHEIVAAWPDQHAERHVSLLVAYGEPGGDSATARTVSLPAAVAGRLILNGHLRRPGVSVPTDREIYEPLLAELGELGIGFEEWSEPASVADTGAFAPRMGST